MAERFLVDRLYAKYKATPDLSFTPEPVVIAEGIWGIDRRNRLAPGLVGPTRSTVIRLAGGGLFVHSPPRIDDTVRRFIESKGPVHAIIVPNPLHHTYATAWVSLYPDAKLYLAPGASERIPALPAGIQLGTSPPIEWSGEIDHVIFGPIMGLSEVVFLHKPTKTLLLTDSGINLQHAHNAWQAIYWRVMGFASTFGTSRTTRMTMYSDPAIASDFVRSILELQFDRIVMCHGDIIETGGHAVFRAAFQKYRRAISAV